MNILSVLLYAAADGTSSISFTTDRRIKFHIRFFSFWYQNISFENQILAVEDPNSKQNQNQIEKIVEVPIQKVTVCGNGVRKFISDGPRSVR
jgi:hypothetical protein